MNSVERVTAALELRVPDKIPFHAYESPENAVRQLGREVHEIYLEPGLMELAMINAAHLYQNDIIYPRPSPEIPENQTVELSNKGGVVFRDKKSGEIVSCVEKDAKTIIPVKAQEPPIKSLTDIVKIPVTPRAKLLLSPRFESYAAYIKEFKGKRFIFGFACGQSANAIDSYLGTENAMFAALEDPGLCRAVMERRHEALREEMLALKETGVDGVYTGDACASCSFFSPSIYSELFFEWQKKSIDFAHSLGLNALLHICGKISPILEDMAATGADVIESLDAPSSGGDIDLAAAKRRVGKKVCLKGNIDAVHTIAAKSPDEIYAECLQAIKDAGPNGYILSTEQITRDTAPENVLAMVRARDAARLS